MRLVSDGHDAYQFASSYQYASAPNEIGAMLNEDELDFLSLAVQADFIRVEGAPTLRFMPSNEEIAHQGVKMYRIQTSGIDRTAVTVDGLLLAIVGHDKILRV